MNRSSHSRFLSFLLALVMVFSVFPAPAMAAEGTVTYTKVTQALDDWTGEYLLVYEEQGFALDGSLETVDAVNNYKEVTIADNTIQTTDDSFAVFAEAVEGGYVLKTASGQYIYHSSDANKISTTTNRDTAAKYPITFSVTDEGIDIALSSGPHMRFNAASDQMRFRYYKSGSYTNQKSVTLYKLDGSTVPEKETVATPTATPAAGAVDSGTTVTFSCATEGAAIQYKAGDGAWTDYTGALTITEAVTFTVKATKEGMNDSAEATFAYTIKSDTPAENISTIKQALDGTTDASFTVKGVVTLVDGKNIYVQDATGGIDLYLSTTPTDIALGDTIIGTGVRTTYNGLPELKNATYEKSSGMTLTAKETTIGELTTADVCTYIFLKEVEVTEVYDKDGTYSNPNITVKDAEGNSIQLYKAVTTKTDGAWDIQVGDVLNVTAAVSVHQKNNEGTATLQLRNTLASEIAKVRYAKLNNTIEDGDQFVIYYSKDSLVMSDVASGSKLSGVSATPTSDDFITVADGMSVLTASVDENAQYTFTNAEGKFLTSGATGNSLSFEDAASDYSLWTIKAVTGGVHIVNVNAAYKGNAQALEYYSGFTTFSEKDNDYYLFNLYELTDEKPGASTGSLTAGDQVMIYNVSSQGVLSLQDDNAESPSITNAAATVEDGKVTAENGGLVFTVEQNGDYYRFKNESFGYLCSNGTGNNAFYSLEASDDADWTLTAGKSGGYNLESRTAKYNGQYSQYLEYYSGSYKTYSMYNVTDYDIYEFFFYPCVNENLTGGVVNQPAVDFGILHEAYVGMDYTFSFTVDAVFGVDGELTVKAGETVLTAGEDGSYTIPKENVTGETLTITVAGKDTKGVAIYGEATVPVKDEPAITDVTPAAGSETGDDKKPVISAVIVNAGENPTVTMTVNGEEVEAVYDPETSLVSYTPAENLADGRTSVTVTVVRADRKEASKSWSFTVGEAQYQLYFGQLHSHTTYSDGSGDLDTALQYVADLPESANVDFVAFTDHSNYFDKSGEANPEGALYDMSLATEYSQGLWSEYKQMIADFNASHSDVVAIGGFEMTWSGGPGHINTFNTPGIVSRNNTTLNNKTDDAGMKAYYALLSQNEGADSISQFNHPGSTFGTFSDFAYYDALIDSRIYLVEVGNGEGAIGAGGYFPSYEYYTMALDKGWHVAPTNNQDNHKGKWGNANDARDVIITDDFTEQGIYSAIRAMRMYATEDKNLEITYNLNGQLLGSTISEVPETLNIAVTVNDPDSSDSISKVEVIVNSGKVAYTWNDPAVLATGNLQVTLDPNYSYYYIRVTEGDGDLAVTAPVWVGESLKLGISSLECGTSTPVTGEELTLTTTLFNSESADATVTSVTYTTGSAVLGTDTTEYTVPVSGTLAIDFKYTPEVAKVMTITATVVMKQNGNEYTFTMDITLDVQDASKLVYIGIDASHYNEYVAGNYKDSMGNFGALAAEHSVRTVQLNTSKELIAACSNEKYVALILTAPSRRDGSALRDPYATYSDAEISALTAFNNAGGTVVLCGWGDYYESYSEFPADDHMAAQQNKVLAALGSSIRISDDETKDDTHNGGQSQRLYLSTYNFGSFLLDGVEYDAENPYDNLYTELYSQYGGASIYVVDGNGNASVSVPNTVTPVVYGFDTTYSSDDDKDSYGGLGSVPKYHFADADRLMVMATEELPGQGLIVVSGAAFLSNFEVQATVSDSGSEKNYSNYKICENLLQSINPTVITDISEVRSQTEVGYKYTIEGVVTSNASGYDKETAFFDCIYVQDETGGICCFPVAGDYKIGDKVRITGTTDFYQGEPELQVSSITVVGEGTVEPTVVTAAQINDRSVEGMLVTVSGTVESFELANGLVQTIMVKDADGNVARVFIDGYITTSKEVENLAEGAEISATGLASYDDTFNAPDGPFPRIRVRNRADVVCTVHEHDCAVDGHIWDEGTETTPATCTEAGVKTYTCKACNETRTEDIPALGHHFVDGTCDRCGASESVPVTPVKPIWHSWLEKIFDWFFGWWK